jgi:serine/threonine protein kinase
VHWQGDWYALGMTLFVMLVGRPIRGTLHPDYFEGRMHYKSVDWQDEAFLALDQNVKVVVRGLLEPNPLGRWGYDQTMQSIWLRQV